MRTRPGSHRNARQRVITQHVITLTAVFALLTQALFPHVHTWHARPAGATRDAATALAASPVTNDGRDADPHSSSSCPLCRARSDARSSLLPPALAVPLPVAVPATSVAEVVFPTAAVVRSVAAPRAPPLAS